MAFAYAAVSGEEIDRAIRENAESDDFSPSSARVADLIRRQKTTGLSGDETAELNQYLHIEHLMRLVKARARRRLAAD